MYILSGKNGRFNSSSRTLFGDRAKRVYVLLVKAILRLHASTPTSAWGLIYELPFRPNLGSREPIVYRGYSFVSQYITSLFPRLKKRKRESCGDGFEGGRSILS